MTAARPSAKVPADRAATGPWLRKHDPAGSPRVPEAIIVRPASLRELIATCQTSEDLPLHACGSHWALSDAAVSDGTFVETHDPSSQAPGLVGILREVVPGCLGADYRAALLGRRGDAANSYPFHLRGGTRLYQAYAAMDVGDAEDSASLARQLAVRGNPDYLGSWAFPTLGGAGGQTVVGAVMTGTHGGDFTVAPLAGCVLALHLVLGDGRHIWVERTSSDVGPALTDDALLRATYGTAALGGPDAFSVVRDDEVLHAVVTSVGRMGAVYSVVVEAVPQFNLHERRRLSTWREVAPMLTDPRSALFSDPEAPDGQRFLQVALCLTKDRAGDNLAGVTRRWQIRDDPDCGQVAGRAERRGTVVSWPDLEFSAAGRRHAYAPDPREPEHTLPPSLLVRATSDPNVVHGAVRALVSDVEEHLHGSSRRRRSGVWDDAETDDYDLNEQLRRIRPLLAGVLDPPMRDADQLTLGEVLDVVRRVLLGSGLERRVGLRLWQRLAQSLFSSQQGDHDYSAISYAVMDLADYQDVSGSVNVASTEVFFDATSSELPTFIDALIEQEARQETSGEVFVGYASLRFTGATPALLGPQLWPLTCAVEVAGLADVAGSSSLIDFALRWACDSGRSCLLHWGQRNELDAGQVAARLVEADRLDRWLRVLERLGAGADVFSSAFTRQLGLEPKGRLSVPPADPATEAAQGGSSYTKLTKRGLVP